MNFLLFIVIGCLAGFIAGKLMRGGGFGLIVNLILGVIGGIFGGWVCWVLIWAWVLSASCLLPSLAQL